MVLAVVALIAKPENEQLRRFLLQSLIILPALLVVLLILTLVWFIVRPSTTDVYVYRDARIRYGRWRKRHTIRFEYAGAFDKPDVERLEAWLREKIRGRMPRPFTRWRPVMRPGMFVPTFNEYVFIQLSDDMRPQFTNEPEWANEDG